MFAQDNLQEVALLSALVVSVLSIRSCNTLAFQRLLTEHERSRWHSVTHSALVLVGMPISRDKPVPTPLHSLDLIHRSQVASLLERCDSYVIHHSSGSGRKKKVAYHQGGSSCSH